MSLFKTDMLNFDNSVILTALSVLGHFLPTDLQYPRWSSDTPSKVYKWFVPHEKFTWTFRSSSNFHGPKLWICPWFLTRVAFGALWFWNRAKWNWKSGRHSVGA